METHSMQRILSMVAELRDLHAALPRAADGPEAFPRADLLYELAHATRCLERFAARWGVRALSAEEPQRR